MDNIDIVIPWVDGGDPEWQASKNKYSGKKSYGDTEEIPNCILLIIRITFPLSIFLLLARTQ